VFDTFLSLSGAKASKIWIDDKTLRGITNYSLGQPS